MEEIDETRSMRGNEMLRRTFWLLTVQGKEYGHIKRGLREL
jgi:hypothetical protein